MAVMPNGDLNLVAAIREMEDDPSAVVSTRY
jgi:hypothetical protein